MRYKLPYLQVESDECESRHGFNEMELEALEEYRGARLRDKVVLRVDLLSALGDYISVKTIDKYRLIIYNLISGNNSDKQRISDVMIALYKDDEVFKKYLGEVYYFNEDMETKTPYYIIVSQLIEVIDRKKELLYSKLEACGAKSILESHAYVYVSIQDKESTLLLPSGFKEEVLSNAKVWKGTIKRC